MALTPEIAASAALAARVNPGQVQKKPVKAFGKILDSLTPEKAEQAGMSPEAVKTLSMQAQNKRFAPGASDDKKLREACEGFESVFLGQMLKEMRKSVPKDGMLDSKYGDQYVSMFDEEFAKTMTKQGGIGLTDFMVKQLAAQAAAKKPQAGAESLNSLRMSASEKLAAQAALNNTHAGIDSMKGLRRAASDKMIPPADPAHPGAGLRGAPLKPLQPGNSLKSPAMVPAAEAARSGMSGGDVHPPIVEVRSEASRKPLDGTPSQHLGVPGAQYLQGEDAKLVAAGMVQPVSGEVTSDYGWRNDPFTGRRAWHGGVDIAAPEGTPVQSCKEGTVVFAGTKGGYGNLVIVKHDNGMESYYGHNRHISVAEGQQVKAGQVLAEVGQTGRATGPHLHFEVRIDGEAVDPAKLGGAMIAAAPDPKTAVPVL